MKTIIKQRFCITVFILFSVLRIYGQELYNLNNATDINNEVNSKVGWFEYGLSTAELVAETDGNSNYSIVVTFGDGTGFRAARTFIGGMIDGNGYLVKIRARSDVNNTKSGHFFAWSGIQEPINVPVTSTTYQEYIIPIVSDGSDLGITAYGSLGGDSFNKVYISSISVIDTGPQADTQTPTAPTLLSDGQTDTTVDLSWSGATDNVGVTAYNIYRDGTIFANDIAATTHQATGLNANTLYDFTVTALDAAGNESVASNTVSVITDASSGGSGGVTSVWTETNSVASYTGDVAIGTGTVPSGYKMAIDGKLITEEVKVQLSGNWPDYVFTKDYDLLSLEEVQKYIKEKGHLPNIPSAEEVKNNGIQLGKMNGLLLEKIEELTLYILEQEHTYKNEIEALKKRLSSIEAKPIRTKTKSPK